MTAWGGRVPSPEPGSKCRLYYDHNPSSGELEIGDIIATTSGSCYLVESYTESPSKPHRYYVRCERLPKHSAHIGDQGVHPLYWYDRGPRNQG